MSKPRSAEPKTVDWDLAAKAFAKTVHDGDIVNFRLLFLPFSPARADSTERFESEKYAYLLPDPETERGRAFQACLVSVREPITWAHIKKELQANRPAQIPSELLLQLADNAVHAGKYTSAAQAYELLRIRQRMQDEFFALANAALDAGDIARGTRGYLIGAALSYDYAAYPEPLPVVPDFQRRALMLHGDYPETPEAAIGMSAPEVFVGAALNYLLLDTAAAARLGERPLDVRMNVVCELVLRRDPEWDVFAARFREALAMTRRFGERLQRQRDAVLEDNASLAREIEDQTGEDPARIQEQLLGRARSDGAWWQYLKELAYEHPPAVLFIARQAVGDNEILVPRCRTDSPIPQALGLVEEGASPVSPQSPQDERS